MMILQHDATWSWLVDGPLSACRATLLRARRAGRLTVATGRVWVTRSGDPDDHVLEAGQTLAVHAHDDVVVEPWQAGAPARLAWHADQARPLAERGLDALAAGVRRWLAALRGAAR